MNNWCICWFFTHIFTEDFKGSLRDAFISRSALKGQFRQASITPYRCKESFSMVVSFRTEGVNRSPISPDENGKIIEKSVCLQLSG
jgi:hypothetical protein